MNPRQQSTELPDPWPPPFSSLFDEILFTALANCSPHMLFWSQLVRFFVNFANLRSRQYICEIVLFLISPLPALPWACFVWLFQSRVEAWDGPLKCPHLANYCLLVILFGDKVLVTSPNIKARIWFSFSLVSLAPPSLCAICTIQASLFYSLFFCSCPPAPSQHMYVNSFLDSRLYLLIHGTTVLIVPWAKVFFGIDFWGWRSFSWKLERPISMWGVFPDLVIVNLPLGFVLICYKYWLLWDGFTQFWICMMNEVRPYSGVEPLWRKDQDSILWLIECLSTFLLSLSKVS